MTLQTQSTPTTIRFAALHATICKSLDWLQSRLKPGPVAPKSARLLRDAGMPDHPFSHHATEQLRTYRDRHMPLL